MGQPGEAMSGRECVRNRSPLIVKDLNGDGVADVVTRDGISSRGSFLVGAGDETWESAVIGDFDADFSIMLGCTQFKRAARRHGVERIENQILKCFVKQIRIGIHLGQPIAKKKLRANRRLPHSVELRFK